jgi:hypothetical protein
MSGSASDPLPSLELDHARGRVSWWAILGLNQWPLPCQRRFALAIATAGCRIGILTSEDVLDGSLVSRLDLQRLLTSC